MRLFGRISLECPVACDDDQTFPFAYFPCMREGRSAYSKAKSLFLGIFRCVHHAIEDLRIPVFRDFHDVVLPYTYVYT